MHASVFVGLAKMLAFAAMLAAIGRSVSWPWVVAPASGRFGVKRDGVVNDSRAAPRGADGVSLGVDGFRRGGSRPPLRHSVQEVDNGRIRLRLNDFAPIVTHMWVDGELAVPHDNIGADFQMTARSDKGDGYNPTQGGDCSGARSLVNTVVQGWNAATGDATARHGVLFEIEPRNYNEPSYPGCLGPGDVLPYDMRFGVTLGDGNSMPRELMLVEMGIRRNPNSTAEPIVKGLSELPVLFLDNTRYRFAYYSVDEHPADGLTFLAMQAQATHDTRAWDLLVNHPLPDRARAIMLCDRTDAIDTPEAGRCIALYAHHGALVQASHRHGARYDLTLIATIPMDPVQPRIADHEMHVERRLVVVGNAATVSAGVAWAVQNLPTEVWQRW